MKYDFDEVIDRRHTGSVKWDGPDNELPMWVADMDFKAAPEIIAALHKRVDHGVYGYCGDDPEWYAAYSSYYKAAHDWNIDKGSLLFCTGVVPVLSSSVRKLTEIGDEVVVCPPVYNIFYNSIVNNARVPLEVPLLYDGSEYEIDWDGLEKAFSHPKAKLFILCNPHNPVGKIWSKDELARIAKLAKEHNVIVLSDEIHGEITPLAKPYVPFLTVGETAKEVGYAAISPTKCFNLAGIQTAAIVIDNPEIRAKVNRQINTDEVAEPNVFATVAAIAAFNEGRAWLSELRRYVFDNRAFAFCSALTSITIPNSVTTIVGNAFYECTGLSEITIPSSVTSIGENAFGYCTGLESIIVEDGNTVYDSRDNCNAIIETETNTLIVGFKNTVIPVSVTSIARVAFSGCSGLSEITIPNSVTSISDFAFHNCESLTSVISLIEEPFEISSNVFEVVDFTTFTTNFTSATLLVPAGTKSKYESKSAWNKFTNIVEMELNSVKSAQTDVTVEEMERYNISGQRISAMQKGLNIVKMSDGTTKKVMFK